MATSKSTPHAPADAVTHSPQLDDFDHRDIVHAKTLQLRALLYCTYGNARETFAQMSDDIQDHYMWACADLAHDIVQSMEALAEAGRTERQVQGGQHG